MSRGSPIPKDELTHRYYTQQQSMQQIATQLGCSVHKVAYWMEQYGFERRERSEATYAYRNPDGDPFAIKVPETPEEWKLFGVGIGLYMGEGSKTGFNVSLSNSDPGIHRAFRNFLEKLCGVDKAALRADLHIYDDCDVDEALRWWGDQLGFKPDQFATPYIRKAHKGGSYSNKARFGTLTVRFSNTRLKKIILAWCSEYCE